MGEIASISKAALFLCFLFVCFFSRSSGVLSFLKDSLGSFCFARVMCVRSMIDYVGRWEDFPLNYNVIRLLLNKSSLLKASQ